LRDDPLLRAVVQVAFEADLTWEGVDSALASTRASGWAGVREATWTDAEGTGASVFVVNPERLPQIVCDAALDVGTWTDIAGTRIGYQPAPQR
jgi:hypothetical protein